MRTIWKFEVPVVARPVIDMPRGSVILSLQVQRGQPCLWAIVDPEAPKVGHRFRMLGTGHPAEERFGTAARWMDRALSWSGEKTFIGTAQLTNSLVVHFFDEGEDL